jgi:hypothetical protein
MALEVRFADRVLNYNPCRFGAILTSDVFSGPAMRRDQLAQARGISYVHRFHARDIFVAELARVHKLLANAEVFLPHSEKFTAQSLVKRMVERIRRHGEIVSWRYRDQSLLSL